MNTLTKTIVHRKLLLFDNQCYCIPYLLKIFLQWETIRIYNNTKGNFKIEIRRGMC